MGKVLEQIDAPIKVIFRVGSVGKAGEGDVILKAKTEDGRELNLIMKGEHSCFYHWRLNRAKKALLKRFRVLTDTRHVAVPMLE